MRRFRKRANWNSKQRQGIEACSVLSCTNLALSKIKFSIGIGPGILLSNFRKIACKRKTVQFIIGTRNSHHRALHAKELLGWPWPSLDDFKHSGTVNKQNVRTGIISLKRIRWFLLLCRFILEKKKYNAKKSSIKFSTICIIKEVFAMDWLAIYLRNMAKLSDWALVLTYIDVKQLHQNKMCLQLLPKSVFTKLRTPHISWLTAVNSLQIVFTCWKCHLAWYLKIASNIKCEPCQIGRDLLPWILNYTRVHFKGKLESVTFGVAVDRVDNRFPSIPVLSRYSPENSSLESRLTSAGINVKCPFAWRRGNPRSIRSDGVTQPGFYFKGAAGRCIKGIKNMYIASDIDVGICSWLCNE